jgi:hypothetical protein
MKPDMKGITIEGATADSGSRRTLHLGRWLARVTHRPEHTEEKFI